MSAFWSGGNGTAAACAANNGRGSRGSDTHRVRWLGDYRIASVCFWSSTPYWLLIEGKASTRKTKILGVRRRSALGHRRTFRAEYPRLFASEVRHWLA